MELREECEREECVGEKSVREKSEREKSVRGRNCSLQCNILPIYIPNILARR